VQNRDANGLFYPKAQPCQSPILAVLTDIEVGHLPPAPI